MSEKYENGMIEDRRVNRPGFGQKVKRHCSRFWWVHLIIFCLIFLLVALLLVYVGMPKIAQHDVDQSSLEFTELQFLNPTPNTIKLTQKSKLWNPSKFTPTLDPFNASFYVLAANGAVPADRITQIQFPEIHATKPYSENDFDERLLVIENLDQITEYATQSINNEYVQTLLKGKTKLHLGKLPTVNVDYYEVSKYKGLNGLKGFNVTNVIVNVTAPAGTPNLKGFAYIPNPSIMTVELGNVTLTLSTEKAGVVGSSLIENMTLKPGNNTLPMVATIDQPKLLSSLTDGKVDLQIVGNSSIYNGEHLVYYERALSSNKLVLNMNVAQILADSAAAMAAAAKGS